MNLNNHKFINKPNFDIENQNVATEPGFYCNPGEALDKIQSKFELKVSKKLHAYF